MNTLFFLAASSIGVFSGYFIMRSKYTRLRKQALEKIQVYEDLLQDKLEYDPYDLIRSIAYDKTLQRGEEATLQNGVDGVTERDFEGLTTFQKIEKINNIVENFPDYRRIHVCKVCRASLGDYRKLSQLCDAGRCDICEVQRDVINYSTVQLVDMSGLSHADFNWYSDKDRLEDIGGIRSNQGEWWLKKYENWNEKPNSLSEISVNRAAIRSAPLK